MSRIDEATAAQWEQAFGACGIDHGPLTRQQAQFVVELHRTTDFTPCQARLDAALYLSRDLEAS